MGVFDTFQIPYSARERRHERMIQEAPDLGAAAHGNYWTDNDFTRPVAAYIRQLIRAAES